MAHLKNDQQDENLASISTEVFVEYYNDNIPDAFPRATIKALHEFQNQYPSLFKDSDEWTINKHRKKFMDWLSSYREK